jgi:hypothetical protein
MPTGFNAEACGEEGATRTCRVKLEQSDEAAHCYAGVQECRGGSWTECGGADVTVVSFSSATGDAPRGGPSTRLMSTPSPDAEACIDDPCNPYCVGIEERCRVEGGCTPTVTTTSSTGGTILGHPGYGHAPSGFQTKQTCGPECASGYPKKCGGEQHYNQYDGCLADHHCDTATGNCVRSELGWKFDATTCPGPDLTVGAACTPDSGASHVFSVCNRGNQAIASGTAITAKLFNPKGTPNPPGNNYRLDPNPASSAYCTKDTESFSTSNCTKTLSAPLEPGACVTMGSKPEHGGCSWSGGNWLVRVSMASAECPTVGCSDNWADIKKGVACQTFTEPGETTIEPLVLTEEYTAECPQGKHPIWDAITFDAQTPCDGADCSTVTFEARTQVVELSGTPGDYEPTSPVIVATAPVTQPAPSFPPVCPASGVSGCPADLEAPLGGWPTTRNQKLLLTITIRPNQAETQMATLNGWQVTYRCEWGE